MNTCCDYGKCDQGRDCPVRKQRMKETNDAYMNKASWGSVSDPAEEVFDTFKVLTLWIAIAGAIGMLALAFWGK